MIWRDIILLRSKAHSFAVIYILQNERHNNRISIRISIKEKEKNDEKSRNKIRNANIQKPAGDTVNVNKFILFTV